MSSNGGCGPSKMATEAMCMWLTSSSIWRNEASSGLRRSAHIMRSLQEGIQSPNGTTKLERRLLVEGPERSDGSGSADRLGQAREEGGGDDPLPGLLIGRLDHARPSIFSHGS